MRTIEAFRNPANENSMSTAFTNGYTDGQTARTSNSSRCDDGIPACTMTATEPASLAAAVQRWRRSVVRAWVVTMFAALAAWGAAAAWTLPPAVELSAGLSLIVLGGFAYWNMQRGRCPRCRTKIRFEPRIELPKHCAGCGLSFSPSSSGADG